MLNAARSIPLARLLAFVTGLVNQEFLLRDEYLVAENRSLRCHLSMRPRLSDPERTLAEIAKRLGRKDVAQGAKSRKSWPEFAKLLETAMAKR